MNSGGHAESFGWRKKRSDTRALVRFHRATFAFLIQLSETDVGALIASERPGDLPNLVHSFYRFNFLTAQGDLREEILRQACAIRANPQRLKSTIKRVRDLLSALADGGPFRWKFRRETEVVLDGAAFKVDKDRGGLALHSPPGALDQAVVSHVMFILREAGEVAIMVRRCERERCPRIFVASRPRQLYCTRKCSSTAAFERYRRGEKYAKAHREASRKYAQKLKLKGATQ